MAWIRAMGAPESVNSIIINGNEVNYPITGSYTDMGDRTRFTTGTYYITNVDMTNFSTLQITGKSDLAAGAIRIEQVGSTPMSYIMCQGTSVTLSTLDISNFTGIQTIKFAITGNYEDIYSMVMS